jgi:hypothetical protein
MRYLLAAAVAAGFAVASPALAAPTGCQPQAVRDLERLSPQGHAIYRAMPDKKPFFVFLSCDNVQLGLSTAVHESVHLLTEQRDAYPLIDGGSVKRVHEISRFFAPREIAGRFERGDIYVQTYLRPGAASSAQDLVYLFDELNAYSHDLNSAVRLVSLHKGDGEVDHRDGLTALMSFTLGYVDAARRQHPATWEGLQRPEEKKLIQTLWTQAEAVLAASWAIPGIGRQDRKYVAFMCDAGNSAALGQLLGRAPMTSAACAMASTASSHSKVAR